MANLSCAYSKGVFTRRSFVFTRSQKKNFFSIKKYFLRGRNMYFTKNRVNLYRFVPIFTIFMFRPLQKKFFFAKSLLPCEKHITRSFILKISQKFIFFSRLGSFKIAFDYFVAQSKSFLVLIFSLFF
jgi:hypothetical protein